MDALDLLVFVGAVVRELVAAFCCHVRLLCQASLAKHWTPTSAVIQASVAEHSLLTTSVRVIYEYQVCGRYYGGCYATSVFNFTAETLAKTLPPRSAALVHYDPRRPERSFLRNTSFWGHYQSPACSVELLKPADHVTGA